MIKIYGQRTMCCKCPPLPVPTGTIISFYVLINVIVGLLIGFSESVYVVGPARIQITTIDQCDLSDESNYIKLKLQLDEDGKSISGNTTVNLDIDEQVKVNFREKPFLQNQPALTYLDQRSFCKTLDNFLDDHAYSKPLFFEETQTGDICPITKGEYYIKGLRLSFSVFRIRYEMLGYKKYQLELNKMGNLLLCLELKINTTLVNLSEFDEYTKIYQDL